jgi:putative addiction module killer protein
MAADVRITRLIDVGPGYRIYYGIDGDEVVLLCGGDKSTQAPDILRAKEYWNDYKRRNRARKRPRK